MAGVAMAVYSVAFCATDQENNGNNGCSTSALSVGLGVGMLFINGYSARYGYRQTARCREVHAQQRHWRELPQPVITDGTTPDPAQR